MSVPLVGYQAVCVKLTDLQKHLPYGWQVQSPCHLGEDA